MLKAMMVPVAVLAMAAAPTPTRADPQREIEAAMTASAAGWNSGDLNAFMAVYAPDATYVTGKGLTRGKDAIAATYRASFVGGGNARGTLTFATLGYRAIDARHSLFIARWTLTPADSAKVQTGMTSLLFERQAGGWKIVADHSS